MKNIWQTTVDELIFIFKGSLTAIIPWMEKAKIPWKRDEAYDDFENIATSIYENIVCTSLYSEVAEDYPIAKYMFSYDDYSDKDYILVECAEFPNQKFAFVALTHTNLFFDSIEVAELDIDEKFKRRFVIYSENLKFYFVKKQDKNKTILYAIDVIL